MAMPRPLAAKSHYTFNVPIDPDMSESKMTIFQVQFHLPYSGSYIFKPTLLMPVDNFVVQMPKSMSFSAGGGASYSIRSSATRHFRFFCSRTRLPGKALEFTVSGTGAAPRDSQQGRGQRRAGYTECRSRKHANTRRRHRRADQPA